MYFKVEARLLYLFTTYFIFQCVVQIGERRERDKRQGGAEWTGIALYGQNVFWKINFRLVQIAGHFKNCLLKTISQFQLLNS